MLLWWAPFQAMAGDALVLLASRVLPSKARGAGSEKNWPEQALHTVTSAPGRTIGDYFPSFRPWAFEQSSALCEDRNPLNLHDCIRPHLWAQGRREAGSTESLCSWLGAFSFPHWLHSRLVSGAQGRHAHQRGLNCRHCKAYLFMWPELLRISFPVSFSHIPSKNLKKSGGKSLTHFPIETLFYLAITSVH